MTQVMKHWLGADLQRGCRRGTQVTEETEALRFNTGIAAMMEFVNAATKWPSPRPATALQVTLLPKPAKYQAHQHEQQGHDEWPGGSGSSKLLHIADSSDQAQLIRKNTEIELVGRWRRNDVRELLQPPHVSPTYSPTAIFGPMLAHAPDVSLHAIYRVQFYTLSLYCRHGVSGMPQQA